MSTAFTNRDIYRASERRPYGWGTILGGYLLGGAQESLEKYKVRKDILEMPVENFQKASKYMDEMLKGVITMMRIIRGRKQEGEIDPRIAPLIDKNGDPLRGFTPIVRAAENLELLMEKMVRLRQIGSSKRKQTAAAKRSSGQLRYIDFASSMMRDSSIKQQYPEAKDRMRAIGRMWRNRGDEQEHPEDARRFAAWQETMGKQYPAAPSESRSRPKKSAHPSKGKETVLEELAEATPTSTATATAKAPARKMRKVNAYNAFRKFAASQESVRSDHPRSADRSNFILKVWNTQGSKAPDLWATWLAFRKEKGFGYGYGYSSDDYSD